jgi:hypothetical protein
LIRSYTVQHLCSEFGCIYCATSTATPRSVVRWTPPPDTGSNTIFYHYSAMPPATPLQILRTNVSRTAISRRFASQGTPQYNEPTGYLFSEKVRAVVVISGCEILIPAFIERQPLPAGQKRVKEEWENIWFFGMFGGMGAAAILLYYKPDTRYAQ